MARSARSAATERAYLRFAPAPMAMGVAPSPAEEFHESDIWGALTTAPTTTSAARARGVGPLPTAARKAGGGRAAAAHGSLPVNIPDWSKILGDEYHRAQHAPGDWEVDDADDDDGADAGAALVPPHELAWQRRRAASLSVGGAAGRTLKVRDAVWKRTTGFQD